MASHETVRDLNAEEQVYFDSWRTKLQMSPPEPERERFDTTLGKLTLIQLTLEKATAENPELLRGLGILFGDALAAELDLKWATVTDEFGSVPELIRHGTRSKSGLSPPSKSAW